MGFGHAPQRKVTPAEEHQGLRIGCASVCRDRQPPRRLGELAPFKEQPPQRKGCLCMARISRKHLPIQPLGARKVTFLMQAPGVG